MSAEPTREEVLAAAGWHLSLVRARAAGDLPALERWHRAHGTVRLVTPTQPMPQQEYEAALSEAASRVLARTLVGAAVVTEALARRYAAAVGRPPDQLLADLEQDLFHARS